MLDGPLIADGRLAEGHDVADHVPFGNSELLAQLRQQLVDRPLGKPVPDRADAAALGVESYNFV